MYEGRDAPPRDASPSNARAPLAIAHAGVSFAVVAPAGRAGETVAVALTSDGTAPARLAAHARAALVDGPARGRWRVLAERVGMGRAPVHWVASSLHASGPERLVLVWEGLASTSDRLRIEELFDRSVPDVAAAVRASDPRRGAAAMAPVIALCARAHDRIQRWRAFVLMGGALTVLAVYTLWRQTSGTLYP